MVVVDSYGATEAGIFSVLSSLVRQMDTEATVDVFYWFKVNLFSFLLLAATSPEASSGH